MSLLHFFQRRLLRRPAAATPLLPRLKARVPGDGAPGLLDSEEEEVRLGERWAAELHAFGVREPLGVSRRAAAIVSAALRKSGAELGEALEGLSPWELPALLEALDRREGLARKSLAAAARERIGTAATWEAMAAAVGM